MCIDHIWKLNYYCDPSAIAFHIEGSRINLNMRRYFRWTQTQTKLDSNSYYIENVDLSVGNNISTWLPTFVTWKRAIGSSDDGNIVNVYFAITV